MFNLIFTSSNFFCLLVCSFSFLMIESKAASSELPEIIRSSSWQFASPSVADLNESKSTLCKNFNLLMTSLAKHPEGEMLKTELRLDLLGKELASEEQMDLNVLDEVHKSLSIDLKEIKTEEFTAVRKSLDSYLHLTNITNDPKVRELFPKVLESLAQAVEAFEREPNRKTASDIEGNYQWIRYYRQVPHVLKLVRARLPHPNLYFQLSREFLNDLVERSQTIKQEINEIEQGIQINGKGQGDVTLSLNLISNPSAAVVEIIFRGIATANVVGQKDAGILMQRHGEIGIYSTSQINGTMRLELDGRGLVLSRPVVSVKSDSQAQWVRVTTSRPRRGYTVENPILESIVLRIFDREESLLNRETEARIASEISNKIQKNENQLRTKIDERLKKEIGSSLEESTSDSSKSARFATTERHLSAVLPIALNDQLGSHTSPYEVQDAAPFEGRLQIHETALNNFASSFLAGKEFDNDTLQQVIREFFTYDGGSPAYIEPIKIRFSEISPLKVVFHDNRFGIYANAKTVNSGDKNFDNVNCSAKVEYSLAQSKGFDLKRIGETEVSCENGSDEARTLVKTFTEYIFGSSFTPKEISLKEFIEKDVKLKINNMSSNEGWLSIFYCCSKVDKWSQLLSIPKSTASHWIRKGVRDDVTADDIDLNVLDLIKNLAIGLTTQLVT